MNRNYAELFLGSLVLLLVVWSIYFGYTTYAYKTESHNSYKLYALFQDISGITKDSEISIAGVKVGKVTNVKLEKPSFEALVEFTVPLDIKIPNDSHVMVVNSKLLGDKSIALIPGDSPDYLADKDHIKYTQSSINFEDLIGKMLLNYAAPKS